MRGSGFVTTNWQKDLAEDEVRALAAPLVMKIRHKQATRGKRLHETAASTTDARA